MKEVHAEVRDGRDIVIVAGPLARLAPQDGWFEVMTADGLQRIALQRVVHAIVQEEGQAPQDLVHLALEAGWGGQ